MATTSLIVAAVNSANATALPAGEMNSTSWYLIAGIIALLILCYLILAIAKPEKF